MNPWGWALVAAALLVGCRSPSELPFQPEKLAEIDAAIVEAIAEGRCPGGVLWFQRRGQVHHGAYGHRSVEPTQEAMTPDTIFDAASLTKVVATAPAVLLLWQRNQLGLDDPVKLHLPEFTGDGRDEVTVRQLLTHTSGLRPGISLQSKWSGYEAGVALACAESPRTIPGAAFRYSDVNFILLGDIVRRVSGRPLDVFARDELFLPLGMRDTGFAPSAALLPRIAPTSRSTNGVWRGVVHDGTARRMNGVAGHAGMFTTASDLARFARMFLADGVLDRVRVFEPETVRIMTTVQSPDPVRQRRGLGWDIDSPYAGPRGAWFPIGSYGHTGWTGGSLWLDPFSESFLIFLSNRNHPTEAGSVIQLRRRLGTLAAEAVPDFNFAYVPGALPARPPAASTPAVTTPVHTQVLNGIDVLVRDQFAPLRGLRVGLITNHTGHDRNRNPTIDLLFEAEAVTLSALFSPEHGIRGDLDDRVADDRDERTGLPVYSLYGETRQPTPGQLKGLDALVFDIQDIGCRFYTYISTMGLCLEAAANANLLFFVLDRVNPITGSEIEGPLHAGERHFVAFHALPLRHGMTVGELARMFVVENGWKTELTIIPVEGWRRDLWLDQTGLPWTNPSPNMRNLTQATLYPGVGLLESALSVGRGTDTPFEVVGAPYADDVRLATELNEAGLAGVRFVPVRFTPQASTFRGQACGGVYMVVTDRQALRSVDLGLLLITTFQRLYPDDFALDRVRHLLRHEPTLQAVRDGKGLPEIKRLWAKGLADFETRRRDYLLYPGP
jgi:uncharacterized protein YbbC (DUF1343 family)/CubicO group peptidase (beta-lactamase class C family)